ncbi:biotin-dependent carboxyltransferase family protein [Salinimicrobium soli]|uniref:5-oxoprolinase subunit C family protein n=1 Tax=Salinimicrobium soli TaxID=1254399 RepID=UPI003AAD1035
MAEVEILHPGLFSSIQDKGRNGYRKFGVPQSGAMDSFAAGMANLLLQNSPDAAVLEMTQQGPKMRFLDPTKIVITGAELSPFLNDNPVENNRIYQVKIGDVLSFGRRKTGCRAYLAVKGGFLTEEVLHSRSFYQDLTASEKLEKGMRLAIAPTSENAEQTRVVVKPAEYMEDRQLEVFPGPEFDQLSAEEKSNLLKTPFSIDRNNNRMAIQLTEEVSNKLQPILTGPVIPGTVQLTPSGKLIVLMRDAQTTGGYPRVLQVSEKGINILAQKVWGEQVEFVLSEKFKVPAT